MLRIGSYVKVADNTGALLAQIIGIKRGGRQRFARIANVVKVAIKKAKPDASVKAHEVHYAVIVRLAKEWKRPDGTYIRFSDNAVVILDSNAELPRGTRIFGPIAREVKLYGFDKIAHMAQEVL